MTEVPFQIRETANGLEARLYAQPRAQRSEIAGIHNGALKIKISAPPVDDAANRAIVDFFADLLDIPKSRVRLASGLKSRNKTLIVEGVSRDRFISALPPLRISS
ncbi:MAG: DUF167 domain-containing protein [Acidobacteriota bacterium]|jgi:uncharacterized protein (TIGR00251 family)|nr:DUF167 domain-containing protein [Acidobacteriota bacterium]